MSKTSTPHEHAVVCSCYTTLMRRTLYNIFYSPSHKLFAPVNDAIALATIISVAAIVLETVPQLAHHTQIFLVIEWVATIIFLTEYILRIIANGKYTLKYVFSFFGVIDLVSILPTMLGLGNFTFLKTARALRIVRLLRMFRLAKITNTKRTHTKKPFMAGVQIYAATLVVGTLIFGTLLYLIEGKTAEFSSIPLAMLWTLKATLGGIPLTSPESFWGDVVMVATRFFGLLLFGLLVTIVGKGLQKFLLGSDKLKQYE